MMFFDLFRREPSVVSVKADGFLFAEGDVANEVMYVLVAGRANIIVGGVVVEDAGVGTIIGEMAMIDGARRSASVRAHTDCEFAEINRRRFRYLVSEAPHFAVEVMRVMADRLRRADRMLSRQ